MPKINNKYYNRFLKDGTIDTELLNEEELKKGMERITGKYIQEARALCILLYYSGARANEILRLRAEDIVKDKKNPKYLIVRIPSSKRGLARKLEFLLEKPLIQELYTYSIGLYPKLLLFYHYKSNSTILHKNKKGEIVRYDRTANKLFFHFKKWFPDYNIYYFRHNRFSRNIDAGATIEDIRLMKGAKDNRSVFPYSHLSKKTRRKLANITD